MPVTRQSAALDGSKTAMLTVRPATISGDGMARDDLPLIVIPLVTSLQHLE